MKPHLYFHLAMWTTIAVVLFFSMPSQAMYWDNGYCTASTPDEAPDAWAACAGRAGVKSYTINWVDGNTFRLDLTWEPSGNNSTTWNAWCDDGTQANQTEGSDGYCQGEPPPPDPLCEQAVVEYPADQGASTLFCVDGTEYSTAAGFASVECGIMDTPAGVRFEVGTSAYGWATSTGQSCVVDDPDDGIEDTVNPDYNLPGLPKTGQTVEIDGVEYPMVQEGCGQVAGSLVCTNSPGCGEFNGEWVCTGPDSGTPGVPAVPDLEYSLSGNTTADRAGDQYFYNSTTVSNSSNLGTGGTSDPTDPGDPEPRTDGSDSGDPNSPLGQGSCPAGYVQTGLTALGDGSTEAQCAPDGGDPDWMGLAEKLDFSDQLPASWMEPPAMPQASGPGSSCPAPLSFSFLGNSIDISLDPFCSLADILRPFLIALGYLFAALFVFRALGSS